MEQIPNVYKLENYASTVDFYDALRFKYRYLVDLHTNKLTYGLCSEHYEKLLCLMTLLEQYEILLGESVTAPGVLLTQNNKIIEVDAGLYTQPSGVTDAVLVYLNTVGFTVERDEIYVLNWQYREDASDGYTKVKALFKPGYGIYGTAEGATPITEELLTIVYEEAPIVTEEFNITLYNNKKVSFIKHPDNTGEDLEPFDYIKDYPHDNTLIVLLGQWLGGDQSDLNNLNQIQWQTISPI